MRWFATIGVALAAACASSGPVHGGATPAAAPPVESVAQADAEVVLDGDLQVLIEDSAEGSRRLYHLLTGSQRIMLRFVGEGPALLTGTPVRVRGRWDADGALIVSSLEKR
jgi:hypothetical protein